MRNWRKSQSRRPQSRRLDKPNPGVLNFLAPPFAQLQQTICYNLGMRHYMKLITVILICLLFISSLLFYKKAFAAIGFGGTILYMQPCSNGILLLVGPPVGGIFLLPPVAKIYPFDPNVELRLLNSSLAWLY